MAKTFFFYDLETSGLSGRDDRVMQFAGIRTDMNLQQIGEPYNVLVKLNDDTLPSPDAVLVTGITPQSTLADGLSEAEFAKLLSEQIFTPDTIAVGFNNVRFDDEFVRHTLWRNFYDPYEWAWSDGRSRWDMLDVVRTMRALRPEGIEWPVDADGNATNRLELLAKANKLTHSKAHDALSDVEALIDVAKLIKNTQPKLFEHLLKMRDKKEVQKLVNLDEKQPFVYVSGRYDGEFHKATVAFPLTSAPNGNVVVYDLRYDPSSFVTMSSDELAKKVFASWDERKSDDFVKLPTKILQYNRCPAVAPLGVLSQGDGWQRIDIDQAAVEANKKILLAHPDFAEKLRSVYERTRDYKPSPDPEAQLYDGFVGERDKLRVETVRNSSAEQLADFHPEFQDERLTPLLLHYKARSYPTILSEDEVRAWEEWRAARLQTQLPGFIKAVQRLATTTSDDSKQFLLQELQLWAEAIIPSGNEF